MFYGRIAIIKQVGKCEITITWDKKLYFYLPLFPRKMIGVNYYIVTVVVVASYLRGFEANLNVMSCYAIKIKMAVQ